MDKIYSIEETAEILQVAPKTVEKWARDKKIRASRIGGSKTVRITQGAISDFMKLMEIQ